MFTRYQRPKMNSGSLIRYASYVYAEMRRRLKVVSGLIVENVRGVARGLFEIVGDGSNNRFGTREDIPWATASKRYWIVSRHRWVSKCHNSPQFEWGNLAAISNGIKGKAPGALSAAKSGLLLISCPQHPLRLEVIRRVRSNESGKVVVGC